MVLFYHFLLARKQTFLAYFKPNFPKLRIFTRSKGWMWELGLAAGRSLFVHTHGAGAGGEGEAGKTLFCLEYKTHPRRRLKLDFEKCEFGFREMQRWISVAAGGSGVWEAVMAAL